METGQSGFSVTGVVKSGLPEFWYFLLGNLQREREDFFRDQDLTHKASPDVPRRLRTCIFTDKTRSQTIRIRVFTYKTQSQNVRDTSEHWKYLKIGPLKSLERFLDLGLEKL